MVGVGDGDDEDRGDAVDHCDRHQGEERHQGVVDAVAEALVERRVADPDVDVDPQKEA